MQTAEIVALGTLGLGLLSYVGNMFWDRHSKIVLRRTEAYVDYLNFVTQISNLPKDSPESTAANTALLEARNRIILYGSDKVIHALRELYEGPQFFGQSRIGRTLFWRVLDAMRQDCCRRRVSEIEVTRILISRDDLEQLSP